MASQNRTITLTLNAETNGAESVRDLASEIQKLGKKGGDAAPEFEKLSKELNDLAARQDAVATFETLTTAVNESRVAMTTAKAAVDVEKQALTGLQQTLDAAKQAEETYAAGVRSATTARQQANQSYKDAKAALDAFVAKIGGAKRVNDESRASYNELTQAVRNAKAEYSATSAALSKLAPEYEALKSATSQAAAAVRDQDHELTKATSTVNAARTDYEQFNEALQSTALGMEKLGLDTHNLTGEQNKLTQSMARLEAEAAKLKTALATPGRAALTTGQQIEQAFGITGVKSAKTIHNEITKISNALVHLAQDATISGADFDRAFASGKGKIAALEAELKKADATTKGFGASIGDAFRQFGPASAVFNIVSSGINAITNAASRIPAVAADFQTLERSLRILTGSTASARKEMTYITEVANRVGADIKSTADGYVKLTAATKGTNLEGKQTKEVFESIVGAMGALGASSSDTEGALMAVTQMVTKGVVSMEEMRQQLGERLPQSFQATAKALGITTAELNDLISTGKMTAEDILPALSQGLKEVYDTSKKNDTLRGQWAEFTNGLKQFADAIGQTGVIDLLLKIGRVGTAAILGVVDAFVLGGQTIAAVMRALKINGDFVKEMDQLADKARAFNDRFAAIAGTAPAVNKSMEDMALEAKKAGREFVYLDGGVKVAVDAVVGASGDFIAFSVASSKAQKSAEGFATSARKTAEYTRASGEASLASANALGDETDKRNTASKVAKDNAAALGALAVEERKLLDILDARALKMAEDLRDGKLKSEAHVKLIAELGEEIAKQKAVVEGIDRQKQANDLLAYSMGLKSTMMLDNSAKMEEYIQQHEAVATAITIVKGLVDEGVVSQEQLNALELEGTRIKALGGDAIHDQIEKISALRDAKLADISIEQAGIRLAIEVQKGIQASARIRGDEAGAIRAANEMKRLEIKMSQLVALAKQAEADASRLLAVAKINELRTQGPMTAAKEAEIRALEAAVKVKEIEAQIAGVTAKSLEELKFATLAAANTADASTGSYNHLANSINRTADAAERLNSVQGGGGGPDGKEDPNTPWARSNGHQADKTVDVEALMYKRNPQATIEEVKAATKYYGELYARGAATKLTGNLGNGDNAARLTNQVTNESIDKALELARKELATGNAIDLGTPVDDLIKKNLATTQWQQQTTGTAGYNALRDAYKNAGNAANQQTEKSLGTLNLTINGQQHQLSTDARGANTLANLFKMIESDSARAI